MYSLILYPEEIKAHQEGRLKQIRRVVKPQPKFMVDVRDKGKLIGRFFRKCPFGVPGDKLWVKETWALRTPSFSYHHSRVFYKDGTDKLIYNQETIEPTQKYGYNLSEKSRWRSSVTMPRWASRYTLDLLSVRVERVQEISDKYSALSGCPKDILLYDAYDPERAYLTDGTAKKWFVEFWNSHNPKYPFDSNPFVWVLEVK